MGAAQWSTLVRKTMSESTALVTLVGRMKVTDLARMVGLDVEALVQAIVAAPEGSRSSAPKPAPAKAPAAAPARATAAPRRAVSVGTLAPAGDPPKLADMLDRATYKQIHNAVDRWYLGHVIEEVDGNVSRAARRLRVSRKRVRVLWARLREGRLESTPIAAGPAPRNAPPPPNLAPLLPRGTYREVHDTVDAWLLRHTLGQVDGNVSQAARQLAVSRKHLRDHLARVGLSDMTRTRGG